jgi:hypothetical protein
MTGPRFSLTREQVNVIADSMAAALRTAEMIADGLGMVGAVKQEALEEAWAKILAQARVALRTGGCPDGEAEGWLDTIRAAIHRQRPSPPLGQPRPAAAIVIRGGEINLAGARADEEDDAA